MNANQNPAFDLKRIDDERTFELKGHNQMTIRVKKVSVKDSTKPTYELVAQNVPAANSLTINEQNIEILEQLVDFFRKPPF